MKSLANKSYVLSFLVKFRQWIFDDVGAFKLWIRDEIQLFRDQFGILSLLYSIVMTKGLESIKSEREDLTEPLIDPTFGHARSGYNHTGIVLFMSIVLLIQNFYFSATNHLNIS